jgi:drug/metabolite transporter (DMT)-like permease
MTDKNLALGHAAMLAFSILIAGSFSLGVQIANLVDPAALTAVRFLVSGAIVGGIAFFYPGFKREYFQAPWRYLVLGGLFAIYFTLMFEGLKTAAPVSGAAVFTLTPVLSALFGYWLLRQVTTAWMALALLIGALGALWVIFQGDFGAFRRFEVGRGELIYFIGCVAHALYTPMVRKLNRGVPVPVFTFGMIFAGWLILTVISGPTLLATPWGSLPAIFWVGLFYVSVCASAMTFFLLQFAAMRLPAANVMAYTYLTPSWVILWEIALGHSPPPLIVLVGVGATFLALLMLLRPQPVRTGSRK